MAQWEDAGSNFQSNYDPNLRSFLNLIGGGEGAQYNTIVGGKKVFEDYSKHPAYVGVRTADGPSTAAGRYQITHSTYKDVAPKLGITDFSPESQDKIAVELIRRSGALDDVTKGDYQSAMKKLGGTWASLPSSPYNQPKMSQQKANAMVAQNTTGGWEDAPSAKPSAGGWEDAPVGQPQTAKPQAAPPKKEEPNYLVKSSTPVLDQAMPIVRKGFRKVDDFVRGLADTMTFGYADEIAAGMDKLTGGGQSGKATYDEALKAQRQRDAEGGGARTAGQITGALVPGAGVLNVVRAPANASRLGRAAAGAASGGATGALYGSGSAEGDLGDRAQGALSGGTIGAATGGILGGLIPASVGQKVTGEIKAAGSTDEAALKAEIAQIMKREFENPARLNNGKLGSLTPKQMNQRVVNDIVDQAREAVTALPKDFEGKSQLLTAISKGVNVSQRVLDNLQNVKGGPEVAAILAKAQKADTLTTQMLQDPTLLGHLTRIGIDAVPAAIGGTIGGPVGLLAGAGLAKFMDPLAKRATGKMTRTEIGQRVIDKVSGLSDDILKQTGPSQATNRLGDLKNIVNEAQVAAQTKIDAAKAAAELRKSSAKKAEANPNTAIAELQGKDPTYLLGLSNPNGVPRNQEQMSEFSKVIREQMLARQQQQEAARLAQKGSEQVVDTRNGVLQATRTPLGGPFQELLQGGKSGLNLTTDEAVKGLRILEKKTNDPVLSDAIQRMRSSSGEVPGAIPDPNAFYGVQNAMRKLKEQGILSGEQPAGILSGVNPVRNPVAYKANVDNAMGALKNAADNAPNKALAQFARKVAGTKDIAAKEKMIADRIGKASPEEAAFLEQFVSPLTQFGKKQ